MNSEDLKLVDIDEETEAIRYWYHIKDSRLLTGDTLHELEFEWDKGCQAYIRMHPSIIQLRYNYKKKVYYFNYNDDQSEYKTVGSVRMLIEALKGDE